MLKANLNTIESFLKYQEMNCHLVPEIEGIPSGILYIAMGVDEKQRDLTMQISILEEDLSDSFDLFDLKKEKAKHYIIHFFIALPFLVTEQYSGDVSRLILLINKPMKLPGFEFSEVDHMVYFRTNIPIKEEIDELILLAAIGNAITFVDTFSETLEGVGTGKVSFEDVIKSLS